jgi:high affinity Mn2+ porin
MRREPDQSRTGVGSSAGSICGVRLGLGALMKRLLVAGISLIALVGRCHAADPSLVPIPVKALPVPSAYDWTGFYVGGHLGYAWGSSNWTAPGISGSFNLSQPIDTFNETGSFFGGLHAGYDYMFPNRVVIGAEADASFPAFPNLAGISIGGTSTFTSPTIGAESYSETVLASGTVRGRIGYAPGTWFFYATGGFAWTYDQLTLTQLTSGTTDAPFLWRLGWAAGAGIEVRIAPHWTASLEYLFTDNGQSFNSDFSLHELRAGLNYRFGNDPMAASASAPATPETDRVNLHGQGTFVWQGYPAIRSPFEGTNSLPGGGEGRETWNATLYAGVRLWQVAELWVNRAAGFPSAESYKIGADYPYTRVQRYFVRQTIDLGGETQKVDAGINQFAGSQTANRLVLTIGKFAVVDIFDTNTYANNPKSDFLNWSVVNNGSFDYASRRLGLHLRRGCRMVSGPLDASRRDFRPVGNPHGRD